MQFANAENMRLEAKPGMGGTCPDCGGSVIAKCGEQRIWHWSHIGRRDCDSWSEPETPWHRGWKCLFPPSAQEVSCRAESGEIHRADVKTQAGLILEFQRSPIAPDEQRKREAFYGNQLTWVVDGTRLKGDLPRFVNGTRTLEQLTQGVFSVFITRDPAACFPRQWLECRSPTFFDFGGADGVERTLWCLAPGRAEGCAVVLAIMQRNFVTLAMSQPKIFEPREMLEIIADGLKNRNRSPQALPRFERWLNHKNASRRRF